MITLWSILFGYLLTVGVQRDDVPNFFIVVFIFWFMCTFEFGFWLVTAFSCSVSILWKAWKVHRAEQRKAVE